MGYYDYDESFYEPSEFDKKVDELKEELRKSVKQNIIDEIESLKKENAELQEFKHRKIEIENEHKKFKNDMECKIKESIQKIRSEKIADLFGEKFIVAWGVKNIRTERPKCDKCDKDRKIHFKSPSGKDYSEYCECANKNYTYEPEKFELIKFSETNQSGEIHKYYSNSSDEEEYRIFTNIYDGKSFDKTNSYNIMFLDKEICQKYCDWKNEKKDK